MHHATQRQGRPGKMPVSFLGGHSYYDSGNSRRRTTYSRNKHEAIGPSRTTDVLSHSQSEASYFHIPTASNVENAEPSVFFPSEQPSERVADGSSSRITHASPGHPYRVGKGQRHLNNDLPHSATKRPPDQTLRPSSNYRILRAQERNHLVKQVQFKDQ